MRELLTSKYSCFSTDGNLIMVSFSDNKKPYFLNIVLLFLKYASTRWKSIGYILSHHITKEFFQKKKIILVFLLHLFLCSLLKLTASAAFAAQVRQLRHLTLWTSLSCCVMLPSPFLLSLLQCLLNVVSFFGLPLSYPQAQDFIMDCVDFNSITSFPASRTSNTKTYYMSPSYIKNEIKHFMSDIQILSLPGFNAFFLL